MYTFRPPDKRRPVVILSRQEVIGLLSTVVVAPVTSTIRGVPSEVVVGTDEGLKQPSAVNLDHVQTVDQSSLHHFVGTVDGTKMLHICRALAVATGCGT